MYKKLLEGHTIVYTLINVKSHHPLHYNYKLVLGGFYVYGEMYVLSGESASSAEVIMFIEHSSELLMVVMAIAFRPWVLRVLHPSVMLLPGRSFYVYCVATIIEHFSYMPIQ